MTAPHSQKFDVAIVGSGAAGSMLAGILAGHGARVALIDRRSHPRFSIGESSTPLADALLRMLGRKHRWQRLQDWATWGGWRRSNPDAIVGKKRGFTYIRDSASDDSMASLHRQRCLVTASTHDEVSDTHWHRATSDRILHDDAIARGAINFSGTEILDLSIEPEIRLRLRRPTRAWTLRVGTLIDASGNGWVHRAIGAVDWTQRMKTHTGCRYAHLLDVDRSPDELRGRNDPFDLDDAAVHHWFGPTGWAWVLRFDSGLASVGWVQPGGLAGGSSRDSFASRGRFAKILRGARRDHHESGSEIGSCSSPGHRADDPRTWRTMRRIQRWGPAVVAPRVWLLPTAAATIDPLHSTGLAHAMAGVDRLAQAFLSSEGDEATYASLVHDEVAWVDRLVSLAYENIDDFERFVDACQLFLVAAIRSEHAMDGGRHDAADVLPDGGLFGVRDVEFRIAMETAIARLSDRRVAVRQRRSQICDVLRPFNVAGLFESSDGVYRRSATKTEEIRDANLSTSTENVT